jgi:hypothetical protein
MQRTILAAAAAILLNIAPAGAVVVCASLATMEACIQCGAKKYGREAQVSHCQANWRPGQKPEHISGREMKKRYGK